MSLKFILCFRSVGLDSFSLNLITRLSLGNIKLQSCFSFLSLRRSLLLLDLKLSHLHLNNRIFRLLHRFLLLRFSHRLLNKPRGCLSNKSRQFDLNILRQRLLRRRESHTQLLFNLRSVLE